MFCTDGGVGRVDLKNGRQKAEVSPVQSNLPKRSLQEYIFFLNCR